ncbi:sulfite exporter TauE/SafE family protein [Endozoicomonas elysicola]|uniref:Probable membrane transporter protein n=1 Tax=Endozoicomonas elysicola TaxID=305900 RepID=A0A081K921_9GAMM|nr:sulfite exporter TauE/SafE family protein [Endozoicomonas elysicola]KEI70647.1 membrane protein [Endozoicomonas elysicola]
MLFLLYLVLGACAGVMAGLFGIGGGLIIVPVLIFSFKAQGMSSEVLTHMAVGTSLATMVITSLSSIKAHQDEGAVQWKIFTTLSIGILAGAFMGVYTAVHLSGHLLQKLLGVFAILVSAKMWFGFKVREGARIPGKVVLVSTGVVIGSVSSMFGIGGGTLSVPFLRRISLTMKQAVGTSAACGLPIALMGALSNMVLGENNPQLPALATGYVYWPAFLGIVLTSVLLARFGARLAHGLPAEKLQKMFAVFLFVVGAQFLV